ncbi:DUF3558 family protein [Rhodococcus sp. NBC_00297]|uniref:DUF3558 family protein n=1 Tax=Rhodococcus sp. NBC_00297 TaxID=2976005 RepID=UPI002E2C71CD|nr:DUF3558 family protein [Rhodococcus sp. NBC_00297]
MSGTAEPVAMELFDPCIVVPDEAIRAAGADPAVVVDQLTVPLDDTWKWCTWKGSDQFLTVFSTTRTLDALRTSPTSDRFSAVDDLGVGAFSFRDRGDQQLAACSIAFDWREGSVVFRAERNLASSVTADVCAVARTGAQAFASSIPR